LICQAVDQPAKFLQQQSCYSAALKANNMPIGLLVVKNLEIKQLDGEQMQGDTEKMCNCGVSTPKL